MFCRYSFTVSRHLGTSGMTLHYFLSDCFIHVLQKEISLFFDLSYINSLPHYTSRDKQYQSMKLCIGWLSAPSALHDLASQEQIKVGSSWLTYIWIHVMITVCLIMLPELININRSNSVPMISLYLESRADWGWLLMDIASSLHCLQIQRIFSEFSLLSRKWFGREIGWFWHIRYSPFPCTDSKCSIVLKWQN